MHCRPTNDPLAREPTTEAFEAHPHCVVCGRHHPFGLHLRFTLLEDGSVQTAFDCSETFQGYPGVLHGGVVSSLLDGAMTNCLFAHGEQAVTGELQVRFSKPVVTEQKARIRAWIDRSLPPFHVLKAELTQNDTVKAKATGKFVKRSPSPPYRGH